MFDASSRYHGLAVLVFDVVQSDGAVRPVRYVERRFLPAAETVQRIAEHEVIQGERLDLIAARHLGDPTQFWRLADANAAVRPEELTETIGRRIAIPLPM